MKIHEILAARNSGNRNPGDVVGKQLRASMSVRIMFLGCLCAAGVARPDTLSLHGYAKIALAHNPAPKIAQSAVDASAASREAALSALLPNVTGSAGLSRSGSSGSSLVPIIDTNAATHTITSGSVSAIYVTPPGNNASAGINASLLLWDFGKSPLQYAASGKSLSAAQRTFEGSVQTTIVNAVTAYYNYLLTGELLTVAQNAQKQTNLHYDEAKVLFEVGKQTQLTVIQAKVDVANAEVSELSAENAVNLARVQLESAAGVTFKDPLVLTDSLAGIEDSIALKDALVTAAASRPDILSASLNLEAARLQLRSVKASYLPQLNASGGYSWNGTGVNGSTISDNTQIGWNFGVALSVPLYEGGSIQASVRQAEATVKQTEATLEQTVLNATQNVEQQYFTEEQARKQIQATQVVINESTEALRLAEERYRAGLALAIEITDAEQTLATALSNHAQAEYNYRVGHVNLLNAMGVLHE
ncbi:MAG: TolC family protein [Chitinispirillaceae bacterium]|jgi:outer membrane protein TolC